MCVCVCVWRGEIASERFLHCIMVSCTRNINNVSILMCTHTHTTYVCVYTQTHIYKLAYFSININIVVYII